MAKPKEKSKEHLDLVGVSGALYILLSGMEFHEQDEGMVAVIDNDTLAKLTTIMVDLKTVLEASGVTLTKLDVA